MSWLAFGIATLGLSLGLRVWHRGPYAPGWDFIGGATGLWLWSTRAPSSVLAWTWEHAFDSCRLATCKGVGDRIWFWNLHGLSIVPGIFAAWVPWLWWPHVWTAAVSIVVYCLLWRATKAPIDLMLLAIASSGLLLSWSLMGLLYVSCLLPHAIALWTIQRWRHRPAWSAVFAAVACALSWQGQELGQLVMAPLVIAALCCRDAPTATRVIFGVIGLTQLGLVVAFPTHNIAGHSQLPAWESASIANVLAATSELPDTVALTAIGIVAAAGLRRERWFWRVVLLVPLSSVVWLVLRTATPQANGIGGLWPRRYLLADFYLLAVTLQWGAEHMGSAVALRTLRVVLLGAALLEVGHTIAWSRAPLPIIRAGQVAALPHTTTKSSMDLFVDRPSVDRALEWISQIRRGEDVLTPYSCIDNQRENGTDPQALPSRVYLAVGHEAFRQHMMALDRERPLCLPLSIETRNRRDP